MKKEFNKKDGNEYIKQIVLRNARELDEKFNLSDKILENNFHEQHIEVKDVKEFIKQLKDELHQESKKEILFHCAQCKQVVFARIDKLAGSQLIDTLKGTSNHSPTGSVDKGSTFKDTEPEEIKTETQVVNDRINSSGSDDICSCGHFFSIHHAGTDFSCWNTHCKCKQFKPKK